ncbi:MAG: DNA/RNA nuclease SfsA [Rhodobacteraceae bacterium]|nr:DNA/RNA nuclease SfsA [Paracoccaceae bacterium]
MRFQTPLVSGRLLRRYKRFLADIVLDTGQEVTAHCPNPGSMLGLKDEGLRVWVEPNDDPKKKLKYAWRVSELSNGVMVGIDTATPNRIAKEALLSKGIAELAAYDGVRPEVPYGTRSRIDFLLTEPSLPDAYVEIKNVHLLRQGDLAEFPDCVTERGAKHLRELITVKEQGARAVMLYVVQHEGCARFRVAADLDPGYAAAFKDAVDAGIEMLAYGCTVSPEEITLTQAMPVLLD